MAKKNKEYKPKTPKELKKELKANRPSEPKPTQNTGLVAPDENLYLKWEQSGNRIRVSGYSTVKNGDIQFDLPVTGVIEDSVSGIARDLDNNVSRIQMADGDFVYTHLGNAQFVEGEYQFINFKYEINED